VLVGYDLWQRRLGGTTAAVGTDLHLDSGPYTIAGVMPRGFGPPSGASMWVPIQTVTDTLPLLQRAATSYALVARLRPHTVSGGLIVQSFARLQRIDLGFSQDRLLAMELSLPAVRYPAHAERMAFVERLVASVRALPGVVAAGVTTNMPLQPLSFDSVYVVEGRPQANAADVSITAHRLVTSAYLRTLGVRLVRGRLLDEHDRDGSLPVVVITEELARQAWPGRDAIRTRRSRG
jgi:putative ABC transport system permease protein